MRRVAAVFAHPDDESFCAGGLLAWCARRGARVQVVALTGGDGGSARDGDDSALGRRRVAELGAACAALGTEAPIALGFPDGQLAGCDREALATAIAAAVGEAPDLLVTHGADGLYGHRDHLAGRAAALAAAEAVGARRVLAAEMPAGLMAGLWRALRKVRGVPIDRALRREQLGIARDAADLILDIRALQERKLAALAAHASQLEGGDPRSFLRPGLVDAVLAEELYTVAAGAPLGPGATDPFSDLEPCASCT